MSFLIFHNKMNHPVRIPVSLWIVLLLSSALIITAARGDLWLDEIWSLSFARGAQSVTDIFVRFKHDNNHPLNTLFLYFVGEQNILFVYRLLAVMFGIGSVFFIGYLAAMEWGYQEALLGMLLAGSSYPLLLYFSEARGYAPAIFFALASDAALRQNMRQFGWRSLVFYWIASILGILSHSTFIMVTAAFCLGSLVTEFNTTDNSRHKTLRRFIAQHAPPLLFIFWWYMFFLRGMELGGGPVYPYKYVLAEASALLLGLPEMPSFLNVALACVLGIASVGILWLYRERDTQWLFFFTILCLAPALLLIVTRPQYLYFRYFLLTFPFFYLLLSHVICKCYRTWLDRRRWFLLIPLATLFTIHAARDYRLLKFGRGDYSAALEYMVENSGNDVVRVGSDHDFRNRVLIDFYAPRVGKGSKIHYVKQNEWQKELPDWIITHSQDVSYMPSEKLIVKGIGNYTLIKVYRFSGVSGWNWYLFRRQ